MAMSAAPEDDHAGESLEPSASLDSDTSTCGDARLSDEEARLNALRLSLAERWRRVLDEPLADEPSAHNASPEAHREAHREEFWEAREMSDIWARADRDPALLSMLSEEGRHVLGAEPPDDEPVDQAALDNARARFQSRMRQEARQIAQQVLAPEVLAPAEAQDAPSPPSLSHGKAGGPSHETGASST